ncbi:MAG TPA: SDR family NAD(P)-dependent oxidoreductase [Puia sp.]|nr:SDR family NAD(P)-dependent oxidoreductase [Puia sp.]
MNTTGKTVLITGGGSGIGFEIARSFSEKGNKVIITGRNEGRLKEAAAKLRNVDYFAADISDERDIDSLVSHLTSNYSSLDVLVNNAANASFYNIGKGDDALEKATEEIRTNYLSVISLTEKLLPVLAKQPEAAIVNVTGILALTPAFPMPTHSASKAALRSYTEILRFTLEKQGSSIRVVELMPPLTNTEFSKPIGGANGIAAEIVAQELLDGLENNIPEIRVGRVDGFYKMFFAGSEKAVAALNQPQG